jgi:pyroglutamyl-peptidase
VSKSAARTHATNGVASRGGSTVLLTGFGPFPGAPFNPTGPLVEKLLRLRRPAFAEAQLVGHVFRTSYAAVDTELPALLKRHRPDIVLMFGLAARTPFLRIETVARNTRTMLLPDAEGRSSRGRSIAAGGPPRLRGRAPFAPLLAAVRACRLPVRFSHNAGRYLCNYAYWRAIEAVPPSRLVLFVHVPHIARGKRPRRAFNRRGVTMDGLVRAGEAVLRTLLAAARRG